MGFSSGPPARNRDSSERGYQQVRWHRTQTVPAVLTPRVRHKAGHALTEIARMYVLVKYPVRTVYLKTNVCVGIRCISTHFTRTHVCTILKITTQTRNFCTVSLTVYCKILYRQCVRATLYVVFLLFLFCDLLLGYVTNGTICKN